MADTDWLRNITTPCSEKPEMWDRIDTGENMNVHRNSRVQEAMRQCREGTERSPGVCPRLAECLRAGESVRDSAPGVYGGVYLGRTRDRWPRKSKAIK